MRTKPLLTLVCLISVLVSASPVPVRSGWKPSYRESKQVRYDSTNETGTESVVVQSTTVKVTTIDDNSSSDSSSSSEEESDIKANKTKIETTPVSNDKPSELIKHQELNNGDEKPVTKKSDLETKVVDPSVTDIKPVTVVSDVIEKTTTVTTTKPIETSTSSLTTPESTADDEAFAKLAHLIRSDVTLPRLPQKEIHVSVIQPTTYKPIDDLNVTSDKIERKGVVLDLKVDVTNDKVTPVPDVKVDTTLGVKNDNETSLTTTLASTDKAPSSTDATTVSSTEKSVIDVTSKLSEVNDVKSSQTTGAPVSETSVSKDKTQDSTKTLVSAEKNQADETSKLPVTTDKKTTSASTTSKDEPQSSTEAVVSTEKLVTDSTKKLLETTTLESTTPVTTVESTTTKVTELNSTESSVKTKSNKDAEKNNEKSTTTEKVFIIHAEKVTEGSLDYLSTEQTSTEAISKTTDEGRSINEGSGFLNLLSKYAHDVGTGVVSIFSGKTPDKVVVSETVSVTKVVKNGVPVEVKDVSVKKPTTLISTTKSPEETTVGSSTQKISTEANTTVKHETVTEEKSLNENESTTVKSSNVTEASTSSTVNVDLDKTSTGTVTSMKDDEVTAKTILVENLSTTEATDAKKQPESTTTEVILTTEKVVKDTKTIKDDQVTSEKSLNKNIVTKKPSTEVTREASLSTTSKDLSQDSILTTEASVTTTIDFENLTTESSLTTEMTTEGDSTTTIFPLVESKVEKQPTSKRPLIKKLLESTKDEYIPVIVLTDKVQISLKKVESVTKDDRQQETTEMSATKTEATQPSLLTESTTEVMKEDSTTTIIAPVALESNGFLKFVQNLKTKLEDVISNDENTTESVTEKVSKSATISEEVKLSTEQVSTTTESVASVQTTTETKVTDSDSREKLKFEIIKAHSDLKLVERPVVVEKTPDVPLDTVREYILVTKQVEKIPTKGVKVRSDDVAGRTEKPTEPSLTKKTKEVVDKTIETVKNVVQSTSPTSVTKETTETDDSEIETANPAEVIVEIPIPSGVPYGSPPISEEFGRFFSHFN